MRLFIVLLFVALTACAHGARRVDCEAHLTAINPPLPVIKGKAP